MKPLSMGGGGNLKAQPVPTPATEPYWEGARRGELMLQRCETTGRHFLYPRKSSPFVTQGEVSWVRASGRGRLYSYVISHIAAPGWAEDVPYVIAIVELEEGVRMMSNLLDVAPDPQALVLDMPLEVVFQPRGDFMLPMFRPAMKAAP
ncbi:MAG: hypothetical protein JWQ11_4591 [Rhizobacter sp.]|nr:hypothetical protein [Rhizobacter sp.]